MLILKHRKAATNTCNQRCNIYYGYVAIAILAKHSQVSNFPTYVGMMFDTHVNE